MLCLTAQGVVPNCSRSPSQALISQGQTQGFLKLLAEKYAHTYRLWVSAQLLFIDPVCDYFSTVSPSLQCKIGQVTVLKHPFFQIFIYFPRILLVAIFTEAASYQHSHSVL